MNRLEIRQQMKNEALNKIAKMYDGNYSWADEFDPDSYSAQRDLIIKYIVYDLNKALKEV